MSAISSVGATSSPYKPVAASAARPKGPTQSTPAPVSIAGHDPDHDGDTDGPGLDVKG